MKKISPHQAKYFAYELERKHKSDTTDKFGAVLLDAKVDLNPHQVEAALFAFKSPFSKGAILADEVGLGKTIEAGIVLSQKWAEGNKRILIICPSSLRKQWMNELADKFYLKSEIIESRNFNKQYKAGNTNPFDDGKNIKICSYHFARNKAELIQLTSWDLVVIDEAHNLRNVYKKGNKIAKEIANATADYKKLLLTATPLQNKVEELFGLASFIDDTIFGDLKSFRNQFVNTANGIDYSDLKERISSICHRTLRRQVSEYINFKGRIPITETFEPSEQEQELYNLITDYLQRDEIYALPMAQRHLMTSVFRKLLASSSFAISGTLQAIIRRLKRELKDNGYTSQEWEAEVEEFYENFDEDIEEWDDLDATDRAVVIQQHEKEKIEKEISELEYFLSKALSIENNAKGDKLMIAFDKGFEKLNEIGAKQKALIFTESTRTQQYLFELLQNTDYKGKVILFNGSNNDELAKNIYSKWLNNKANANRITGSRTVDIRNAIVDEFKTDECQIMIATEAAAEGINLQFCSMIVNYDLPWNPQRIEQRIGRCHRYGQDYDVVVVNFLNTKNETDLRVFELLEQKFHLFDNVFGASDEVLGAIGNGVDFEKRLIEIYKKCRTPEEINQSFEQLTAELDEQIKNKLKQTQEQLFENFDAEVIGKLKTTMESTQSFITKFENWLWKLTKFILDSNAVFDDKSYRFYLQNKWEGVLANHYTLDKKNTQLKHYRLGDHLAKTVLQKAKSLATPTQKLVFDYSGCGMQYKALEQLNTRRGFLKLSSMQLSSTIEDIDMLIFAAATHSGENVNDELCQFLLTLNASIENNSLIDAQKVERKYQKERQKHLDFIEKDDARVLKVETTKFEKWANDKILSTEKELEEVKKKINELQRDLRADGLSADEVLDLQSKLNAQERKKKKLRVAIFDAEDQIIEQRDEMIATAREKIKRQHTENELFTIEWEII